MKPVIMWTNLLYDFALRCLQLKDIFHEILTLTGCMKPFPMITIVYLGMWHGWLWAVCLYIWLIGESYTLSLFTALTLAQYTVFSRVGFQILSKKSGYSGSAPDDSYDIFISYFSAFCVKRKQITILLETQCSTIKIEARRYELGNFSF